MNVTMLSKLLQDQMSKVQGSLSQLRIEGEASFGQVKCTVDGHGKIQSIVIEEGMFPSLTTEEREMLCDLLVVAVRQAQEKAGEASEQKTSESMKDLLPPNMKFPF